MIATSPSQPFSESTDRLASKFANKVDSTTSAADRHYFLDWVRIVAFGLLILYHVGMYYVSWGWHIKSEAASSLIEPLMFLTNPWRMSLLFMVSGVATHFMLRRQAPGRFAASRSGRILLPLLFGMAVIVPPQAYLEVVQKLQYQGSYADFLNLYFHAYKGFVIEGKRLVLPTWNHLWFLAYLWTYSMLIAIVVRFFPRAMQTLEQMMSKLLSGKTLLLLPIAYLALTRITLLSGHPPTNNLTNDWYNHANYFFYFLIGYFVANNLRFWDELAEKRWRSLSIAVVGWVLLVSYFGLSETFGEYPSWLLHVQRAVWVMMAWNAILALCGFARKHWNFDSAARAYLTNAVFPAYIVHQTAIILLAWQFRSFSLNPAVEALLLILGCGLICSICFEISKKLPYLRRVFGLS